jgi:VWFA-related protein
MLRFLLPLVLLSAVRVFAQDDPAVFKAGVDMTRVDAQVVDRNGRAVTGLRIQDFILRLDGQVLPIRNLASENVPIDILLLLDVSGSMEPHVERIASAAREALQVLADRDRVAIMVFDTSTRVRLPFRSSHSEITAELNHLIRSERFNGGTRITSAMMDAAGYMRREARPEARRAIVILTDDQTQDGKDEASVESALARSNIVLSFLQAPYEPPTMNRGGQRVPMGGGGWPGSGGGLSIPGTTGPVILGRGGRRGMGGGHDSHSAGTDEIARDSGGDTMRVDEASALEDTLARLRQRYALYFYLPEGAKPADRRNIEVNLAQQASIRFQEAEIRYRRVYLSGGSGEERTGAAAIAHAHDSGDASQPVYSEPASSRTPKGRRVAVNEDSQGPSINMITPDPDDSAGQSTPPPVKQTPPSTGWPRVKQ